MLLDHYYEFGLSLKPSSLKTFAKGGALPRPTFACPRFSCVDQVETATLIRNQVKFVPIKFHKNQLSGSEEEAKNVSRLHQTDDDGRNNLF